MPGRGALGAAKIVGERTGLSRFADEARSAVHAGVAPIPGTDVRLRIILGPPTSVDGSVLEGFVLPMGDATRTVASVTERAIG